MRLLAVGEAKVTMQDVTRAFRHLLFWDEASPGKIPGVCRGGIRPEQRSNRRSTAVGSDEQVACIHAAVIEVRRHLSVIGVLVDADEPLAAMIVSFVERRA